MWVVCFKCGRYVTLLRFLIFFLLCLSASKTRDAFQVDTNKYRIGILCVTSGFYIACFTSAGCLNIDVATKSFSSMIVGIRYLIVTFDLAKFME